jgi:hypothetical protein
MKQPDSGSILTTSLLWRYIPTRTALLELTRPSRVSRPVVSSAVLLIKQWCRKHSRSCLITTCARLSTRTRHTTPHSGIQEMAEVACAHSSTEAEEGEGCTRTSSTQRTCSTCSSEEEGVNSEVGNLAMPMVSTSTQDLVDLGLIGSIHFWWTWRFPDDSRRWCSETTTSSGRCRCPPIGRLTTHHYPLCFRPYLAPTIHTVGLIGT